MVMLHKIISFLILALAIATLVFAVKLHSQREVIVNHRVQLVEALKDAAKATGRTVDAKFVSEAGEISDETIKADKDKLVDSVSKLKDHKDFLALAISEVGKKLELDAALLTVGDLQSENKAGVEGSVKAIATAAADITARDKEIFKAIEHWGKELESPVNNAQLKSVSEFQQPLKVINDALSAMKSKNEVIIEGVKGAIAKVNNFEWNFSADELALASEYKSALEKFQADMEKLSVAMGSVKKLEDTIKDKDGEIADRDEVINARNEALDKARSELAELRETNNKINEKLKEYEVLTLDTSVIGTVNAVNKEFGFIIIDLGKGQVQNGLQMYIRRGEAYIATVEIIGVQESSSLAEIRAELNKGEVMVGDKVIFTTNK